MSFTWSKYQQAIFNYALDPDKGSFCIEAVAGSGKTTVLVETAKRLAASFPDEKILFVAFNRTVADKLTQETKEYPNMSCYTAHSFGMHVLLRSKLRFRVDNNKWFNYIKKYYKRYVEDKISLKKSGIYIGNCLRLFNMCRYNLVNFNLKTIKEVADLNGILCIHNEVEAVKDMLEKASSIYNFREKTLGKPDQYVIDFADMINLPLTDAFRKYIPKYAFVMCDEAQDMSKAQQQLIVNSVQKNGKLIPIGDSKQSIYYFATGKANTFDEFKKICGNVCLPLSVSYRCGKNIVKEAQKINPEIEAFSGLSDGEVVHQEHLKNVESGDMILCRKTTPLIQVALKFLAMKIPAYIKGHDIYESLCIILDRITENDNSLSFKTVNTQLDDYLERIRERLVAQGVNVPETHYVYVKTRDDIEAIRIIGKGCETIEDIKSKLNDIFSEDKDGIILSTVHRAKGFEADNVFIICPEILPMITPRTTDIEKEQENNLKYVAVTRAKHKLTFVDVDAKMIDCVEIQ